MSIFSTAGLLGYSAGKSALSSFRGMSLAGKGAVIGAGYGAFSNDTSMIGGAMWGAALGGAGSYGRTGVKAAQVAMQRGRAAGMGGAALFGRATRASAMSMAYRGRASAMRIGRTAHRAYNNFSGFANNVASGWRR